MVAIFALSMIVEFKRSHVTGPPILIPAIQWGSGTVGKEKRVVPGTGTPITIPVSIRKIITASASFKAKLKLPAYGPSLRNFFTIIAINKIAISEILALFIRTKVVAMKKDHSHQLIGWNLLAIYFFCYFLSYFFKSLIRDLGVSISVLHSFAG